MNRVLFEAEVAINKTALIVACQTRMHNFFLTFKLSNLLKNLIISQYILKTIF